MQIGKWQHDKYLEQVQDEDMQVVQKDCIPVVEGDNLLHKVAEP